MADVVEFTGITTLDVPVDRVLSGAQEHGLGSVVVIGFGTDGDFYFASNKADGGEILWLMELAKAKLIKIAEEMSE